jgi:endonuclease/exonuclease/phosphatase family metal-dependent hydrolase
MAGKRRKKRWVAFFVVALCFSALLMGNRRINKRSVQATEVDGFPIEVVAFNAHFLPPVAEQLAGLRSNSAYRVSTIAEKLRNYDIVGISEAFHESHAADLIDDFNSNPEKQFTFVRSPVPSRLGQISSGGLLLFSRFPILESDSYTFTDGSRLLKHGFKGADGLSAKGVLHARILTGGKNQIEIDCYLTHMESFSQPIRRKQIKEAAEFIASTRTDQIPYLVFGDFNVVGPKSSPKSSPKKLASKRAAESDNQTSFPEYDFLVESLKINNAQITDVGLVEKDDANRSHFEGTSNATSSDGRDRIDYVFFGVPQKSHRQFSTDSKVMPFLDANVAEGSLSDHAGVWCRISVEE